ncbi:peptide-methionine (R)-S-oxide reductase [Chaetoceros tenuissimus]|uniref:Peptide-methionine (R)-S-oxide reductase n=1 Tax=Chaetoceros tenuissimus TaxID=426638 RepID=A0AAD3H0W8_9STRA|nr:peptide-methionine (R)-S-oxide reductase [Chaetoceros tenuissimus]
MVNIKSLSLLFISSSTLHSSLAFHASFQSSQQVGTSLSTTLLYATNSDKDQSKNNDRLASRKSKMGRRSILSIASSSAITLSSPNPSLAMNNKSRTEGYAVQHTEREWAYILSGKQYNILREGGTERPNSSILESEERDGEYRCAGCNTPLFASSQKFHSGTGWPSFATGLAGVEVENVNPVQANLLGAEIRCATCGGHLGDVFNDGYLFVNTPAFSSGKRFCVDGSALIFKPSDGSEEVFGDTAPPAKKQEMPDFLAPPKINARDR